MRTFTVEFTGALSGSTTINADSVSSYGGFVTFSIFDPNAMQHSNVALFPIASVKKVTSVSAE